MNFMFNTKEENSLGILNYSLLLNFLMFNKIVEHN